MEGGWGKGDVYHSWHLNLNSLFILLFFSILRWGRGDYPCEVEGFDRSTGMLMLRFDFCGWVLRAKERVRQVRGLGEFN